MSEQQSKVIRHCPVCGEAVSPLFEWSGETSVEGTVECPNHGEIMIEYHEP